MQTIVMALRADPSEQPEAADSEPVTVDVQDGRVHLALDDGLTLDFDAGQLRQALATDPPNSLADAA